EMTVYAVINKGRIVVVWDTELAEKTATQLHDFLGWWKDMEPWDQIVKISPNLEAVTGAKLTEIIEAMKCEKEAEEK
ncbi:MAG: hypothetical protein DRJ31_11150, partial [Candidatus Methanomethylicota archaeon]